MRVLLVAGKGGVGKTTLAAATALAVARTGARTLVVSTDPAHSLTDALGMTTGTLGTAVWRAAGTPVAVPGATGPLDVLQVDTRARFDGAWATLRRAVGALLVDTGIDPLVAEEIATVPGAEDVLALLEVGRCAPAYDAVVIDCAPTAETLRLLALPEALDRLVARGLPVESRIARIMAGRDLGEGTVEALDSLDTLRRELLAVRALVTGPDAAVRLVTTPERVVLAETQRARTTLAMLGHHVESVVVNRVAVGGCWPEGLVRRHREGLVSAHDHFAGLPVRHAPYTDEEPVGVEALITLADAVLGSSDPLDLGAPRHDPLVRADGDRWLLEVAVPLAAPDEVSVSVTDSGDLVVDLGPYRRVIELPAVLRRCEVSGASLDLTDSGQVVRVRFDRDLDAWSRGALR